MKPPSAPPPPPPTSQPPPPPHRREGPPPPPMQLPHGKVSLCISYGIILTRCKDDITYSLNTVHIHIMQFSFLLLLFV